MESEIKIKMEERHTTQKTRRESEIAQNYLNAVIAQQALDATAIEPAGIDMRLFRDLVYVAISLYHELLIDGREERARQQQWELGEEFVQYDSHEKISHAISNTQSGLEQQVNPERRYSHYHTTTLTHVDDGQTTNELHRRKGMAIIPNTTTEGQTNIPFSD